MRIASRLAALAFAAVLCMGMGGGHVVAVYPSGASVPANLLRVSIRFDRPPAGPVLPRLSLAGARLAPGQAPFLDQELWAPDGRTLTLLFDPARVKTGVGANEILGRVLREGEEVTLRLDGQAIKAWRVAAADTEGPKPRRWRVHPPRSGARDPLRLELGAPIDMLDQDLVAVAAPDGRRVAGAVALRDGERRWSFTPDRAWSPGAYQVLVSPELEDEAGNAVAQAFEFSGQPVSAEDAPPVSLPFIVR